MVGAASPIITIHYQLGRATRCAVWREGLPSSEATSLDLGLAVLREGEAWHVSVTPVARTRIVSIEASIALPVSSADAVYLNGYQSWTDSVERAPGEKTRGLDTVPRWLVDKYVLDGSGDYRFTSYDRRRGYQHGYGYGYLRKDDEVTLFGSLCEDSGLTCVRTDAKSNRVLLQKEPPARAIQGKETLEVLSLAITHGTLDEAFSRWVGLCGAHRLPAPPIVGFSSWYRHYADIDAEKLSHDLAGLVHALEGVDLGQVEAVFQIDDGFAKVGDWLEYDVARFPNGLAPLADAARAAGLVPGLWLAPFVCERESRLFAEHQSWLQRYPNGRLASTGCNWSGGYALDIENSEVRDYLSRVLHVVTREWGFKLLKLDFLFGACMVEHTGKNRGQLMADALDFLRSCVDDDVRLLMCGVPMVSAFGRCEYCRIGCDVGLDWDDKPHMRLLHRERVSTKRSLANTKARAHLDRVVFRCDPDVFFLRDDVDLTPERRDDLISSDIACGGVLLTSDDMGSWDEGKLARYHDVIATFVAKEN